MYVTPLRFFHTMRNHQRTHCENFARWKDPTQQKDTCEVRVRSMWRDTETLIYYKPNSNTAVSYYATQRHLSVICSITIFLLLKKSDFSLIWSEYIRGVKNICTITCSDPRYFHWDRGLILEYKFSKVGDLKSDGRLIF